jgi:hypothetical protein
MAIQADSRTAAFIEGWANTALGFIFSVLVGLIVYPLFGWEASLGEVTGLTFLFTVLSFVRAYGLRRLFVWLKAKGVLS